MPDRLGTAYKTATIAPASHTNHGNWVCEFSASDIGISEARFQCYHVNVINGPLGSKFQWGYNNNQWETVYPGWDTSWDPNNPMKVSNGDTIFFWWNSGTGTAATVWLYFEKETPL